MGGRLVGIEPGQRHRRAGKSPIATPRGTNDVERLVDLVGTRQPRRRHGLRARLPGRRSAASTPTRGTVLWTKPANGAEGVDGDDALRLSAPRPTARSSPGGAPDGERAWTTDALLYRGLTAPLARRPLA